MTHALIKFSGKQYRVEEGSSIKVPHVHGKVGTKVSINNVLYMEIGNNKTVGFPFVEGRKILHWEGRYIPHHKAFFYQVLTGNFVPFHFYIKMKARPAIALNMGEFNKKIDKAVRKAKERLA